MQQRAGLFRVPQLLHRKGTRLLARSSSVGTHQVHSVLAATTTTYTATATAATTTTADTAADAQA